ncbi:MAG: hypothetical protein ABIL68_16515 [bacterium]
MCDPIRTPVDPFSEYGLYFENDSYPKTDFTQMEFRGAVDENAMCDAFEEAVAAFPVYHSHLHQKWTGGHFLLYWETDMVRRNRLIVEDCRNRAPRPFDPMRFFTQYFGERMQRRIDLRTEFPLTGYLLRVDNDRYIFSICYHHIAMNPQRGYRMLTDMLARYHMKVCGVSPPWSQLPGMASLGRQPRQSTKDIPMRANALFAAEYARSILSDLIRRRPAVQLACERKLNYRRVHGRHSLRLRYDDPIILDALVSRAARSGAQLNDIWMALTHRTITRWNKEHDAPHDNFKTTLIVSLQGRLKLPEHEGVGLSCLNFQTTDLHRADLDELITHFRQRRFGMLRRMTDIRFYKLISDAFASLRFMPLRLRKRIWPPLILTVPIAAYVSNLGVVWPRIENDRPTMDSAVLGAGGFEISDIHSSPSLLRNVGLGITTRVHARRLFINFVCDSFRFREEEARSLVAMFADELTEAVS